MISNKNNVIVAHNAQFAISIIEKGGIRPSKVICTLKMARFLDKEGKIPKYNLQYLRYYLNLNIAAAAHDALGDILVLEGLFKRIYAKAKELFGDKATEETNGGLKQYFGVNSGKSLEILVVFYHVSAMSILSYSVDQFTVLKN